MAESTQAAGAQQTQQDGGKQSEAQAQQAQAQQQKTFTQEELDERIRIRLEERKSKYADYDDLKRYHDEAEAKNKSELEKLADKATKAEAEAKQVREQSIARVLQSEARAIAAEMGFTKPDKAVKLADLSDALKGGEKTLAPLLAGDQSRGAQFLDVVRDGREREPEALGDLGEVVGHLIVAAAFAVAVAHELEDSEAGRVTEGLKHLRHVRHVMSPGVCRATSSTTETSILVEV